MRRSGEGVAGEGRSGGKAALCCGRGRAGEARSSGSAARRRGGDRGTRWRSSGHRPAAEGNAPPCSGPAAIPGDTAAASRPAALPTSAAPAESLGSRHRAEGFRPASRKARLAALWDPRPPAAQDGGTDAGCALGWPRSPLPAAAVRKEEQRLPPAWHCLPGMLQRQWSPRGSGSRVSFPAAIPKPSSASSPSLLPVSSLGNTA